MEGEIVLNACRYMYVRLQFIALAVSLNEFDEIFECTCSSVLSQLGSIAVDEDGWESIDILFGAEILVIG